MLNLPEILARPGSILLENSLCRRSREGDKRSHLFQNPLRIIQCFVPSEVPGALAEIDKAVSEGLFAAGYLAYECGYELAGGRFGDATTVDWGERLGYPILWFGLYKEDVVLECGEVDNLLGVRTTLNPGQTDAYVNDANAGLSSDGITLTPTSETTKFADAIHRIHELIHEGDLYQVNYTIRFIGELARRDSRADSLALFRHMRERQPVNYAAYLQLGDVQILSASPEQFFDRDGSSISVRPMKGTAPRGETSRLAAMLELWLQTDEKNRSENLMILDLLRNDLSRVCTPGSVTADSLFEIEKYRSVIQMTSPVEGELNAGANYLDIFNALFPSGSITGAPKIRAMVRIRELESEPRGIYCGSIGFIDPASRASFSVAIRTVSVSGREIITGSGGGIVWDSDAREEYRECLLKTRYLGAESSDSDEPIQLIESMICHGDIALIDRHLRRLERSAEALEFKFDPSVVVNSIDDHIGTLDRNIRFKVRLLLAANGTCSVTSVSISAGSRVSETQNELSVDV